MPKSPKKITKPYQLDLFSQFSDSRESYSNTISLYDLAPKYFWGKNVESERKDGTFLRILSRTFTYQKSQISVDVNPARIKTKKQEKEYYPTAREEIIEDALRKIATDGTSGVYIEGSAGVQFTLYALQKELKANGHNLSIDQIKEALEIGNKCNITLKDESGCIVVSAPIFPTLALSTKEDIANRGKKAFCIVTFNPLVTDAINKLKYRQHKYIQCMRFKKQLSRYLYKRFVEYYTYAHITKSYHFNLSTIVRDSGMKQSQPISELKRQIEIALKELKENKIIIIFQKEVKYDELRKNKIVDIKYTVTASSTFSDEMVNSNKRTKDIRHLFHKKN